MLGVWFFFFSCFHYHAVLKFISIYPLWSAFSICSLLKVLSSQLLPSCFFLAEIAIPVGFIFIAFYCFILFSILKLFWNANFFSFFFCKFSFSKHLILPLMFSSTLFCKLLLPCFLALSYMCCHIGYHQVTDSLIDTNWNSIAGSCSFMVSVVSAVTMVTSFDPYRFSQFDCFSLLRCSI